jgi:peptidoglycan-associated lipoprotein
MKSALYTIAALVLLAIGLSGCNRTGGASLADATSGLTDDPAVGFAEVKAGTEEDFIMAVGRRIYFKSRSAELGEVARETLDLQAAWLIRHPNWLVKLQGFADDPGSGGANVKLSTKRADAVMTYLADRGVNRQRMWAKGYGKERPVRNCSEISCKAQNRRVVVNLRRQFDGAAPQYKRTSG